MAAHDLINAAIKANDKAMKTAIKNGLPVQLPANQYLPKAMNGNIDVIHLGQFADLDAGFDDYRKQQAAQQAQAANQDFSDLDAGFAEWSAGQGGPNVESMRISPVEAPKTASTSTGGQSTGSRSKGASRTASAEIPSLDNMAVPVTAKTTKAEKKAEKEVKQANSTLSKADKALQTAQKKQTVAENNLRKKLDRAENEAQKADAAQNAVKVTKRGKVTVVEPAQNVQQTKRKMQGLAKEEARAQAEYTKAQNDVRKAEERAKKAADRQQAANDRAQAASAFAARRTANSGTVSSAEQVTNNAVRRDIIDQAVNNQISSYNAMPKASAVRGTSGRVHSGNGRGIVLDNDSPIQQLESTMPQSTPVTWNQPTQQTVPEISALQQAVRADALAPKTATMLTPAQAREMGLVPDEVIGQGGQPGTTVNAFTDQDMRTVWANPDYKLDDEEYARAKKMSEDYFKQNFRGPNDRYFVGNPSDQTDGTVEEMSRIYNKTHQGAAFTGGVLDSASGVGKVATRGAVKLAEQTGQDDLADALADYSQQMDASIAGARTQHPVTSTLGTMAGKAAQYAATNPYFDSIAEASGLTGAAKFALNQGAQLAQDYAVSDLPQLYEDLSNEDLTTQQALRNLGVNTLQDAAGNLAMGALSDYIIPKLTGRGAVESAGDAARAVSNTPAPVDDSLDAALYGTGIMQDLTGGSRADIPELGRPFQESNLDQYQWDDFIGSFTGTDAGSREGADIVRPYVQKVIDYDAGRATLDEVDEAFNEAQFRLNEAGLGTMNPEAQRIINPDYSGPTAMYDHALRKFGEKYPEQAGAYRQAQDAYNAVINNPEATREEIIAAHEQLVKAANGFDGKIRRGEAAPRKAEINEQLAELKRNNGAGGSGKGTMKIYADPEWVEKQFGTKTKTAQERLEGTGIVLVSDPRKASKNIPIMDRARMETFLSDAIRMQSEKNGLEVSVNTYIGGGKNSEKIRNLIYSEIAEQTNDSLRSHGYWGLDELSPEQQAIKDFESEEWVAMVENYPEAEWRPQAEAELRSRLAEIRGIAPEEVESPYLTGITEQVDEIPQMRSIAEDTGIPNQTDEVLNIGADEIPSMEEVDSIAARRAELQARADGIDDVGGTFYDRHTGEVVPQEVVEQLDADLREANRQFDEAVANAPEPKDIGGVRPQTVDDSDELPFLADEPAAAKSAEEATSDIPILADNADEVADATRATNADAVPESGARTAEAVNGPDEPNIPLGEKERGFAKSSRKKGLIDDEIKAKITDRPLTYKQLANKETAERARQLFADTETFDDGERILKGLIDDNDAAATMYAKDLVNAYAESGQTEAAMKVMDQISTALTKRGQFTQAAVLALAKDDPMTALQYVQKELKNLNADGLKRYGKKWKDFSLTEEEIKLFENIKPGDEEAIKAAYDQIGKRIGKEFPSTLPEKWLEARRIAMLLNVRTNIRNIGANIPTAAMRTMSDRVEAVGQHIYKLWNPDFEITQSVTGNLPGTKFRQLAADIFNNDERMKLYRDAQHSKYNDLKGGIMENRQVFHANALEKFIDQSLGGAIQKLNLKAFGKEGVQSGAETLRNLTYKLLDIGDSPFVRENFVDRLASYMKAQGIEDAAQVPDEAIAIAWEEAMKATYKDDSWMNAVVGGAKNSIAKIPKVGKPLSEALIPFVQAPANIGARMVDYSPIRGGKGVADLIKGAKAGDDVLVRKGIEEMSKGLTGTGLAYLGYKLHQSGILTGSYSDNKRKRAAQQEAGFKEWALHIGDRYYTYDWMQPSAQSLIAGTIIADAMDKSDEVNYALLDELGIDDPKVRELYSHVAEVGGVSKDIGKALVNSWFNASPLNSLSGFMGSSSYGWEADIGSGLEDTARNFVTSFIPSLSGAIARGTDTTVRATKDGRSDAVTLTNQIKAKIPGLSKTLPAAYDAWGREKTRGDSVQEAMISQNLIPGETGIERLEPYEEEAARLADAMGDDALYPFVADYKVGDKKLSTKEREEYQHVMGDRSREIVEALMATEAYQTMDDSQKAEAFKAIYSASKSMAENQLFSKDIAKANQKLAQAYADGGAEGAANFLTMKTAVNDAGLRVTENNQKIYDEYGQEGIQQLIELTDQFDAVKQARKDSGLDNNINIMTTLEMLNGSEGNAQLILNGLAKSNQLDPEKFEQRSDGSWVYNQKEGTTLELTDAVGVEPVTESAQEAEAESSEPFLSDISLPEQPQQSQAKAASKAAKQQMSELRAAQQPEVEEIPVLEEQPVQEEPKPVQQTASNVEINPATGRPVAPTRQTEEPAVEIDPRTGRPKAPTRSGEAVQSEIPKLEPNGNATWNNDWEIEKSKSWGRFRQIDPSYTTSDYARVYNAMDKDKNGKLKSAEIQSYLNAMSGVDDAYRWAMFNAFANQGWGNPYKK